MTKKILIISGSPRKGGNSDILCDKFLQGAIKAGHEVEKIFLGDQKIGYCTACSACQQTGKCVQKDDMAEILAKMIRADVLVLASPVYFYSIAAQIKALIDRTAARWTEIRDKEFYYIVTAADAQKSNLERSVECFRGFADCFAGSREMGVIYGAGVHEKGEIENTKSVEQALAMGEMA